MERTFETPCISTTDHCKWHFKGKMPFYMENALLQDVKSVTVKKVWILGAEHVKNEDNPVKCKVLKARSCKYILNIVKKFCKEHVNQTG